MTADRRSRPKAIKPNENKSVWLFRSVCPETGRSAALFPPVANTNMMNLHLEYVAREVAEDEHAVAILDNAAWHRSRGLRVPSNITLLHLPPYSPELNPLALSSGRL